MYADTMKNRTTFNDMLINRFLLNVASIDTLDEIIEVGQVHNLSVIISYQLIYILSQYWIFKTPIIH